MSTMKIGVHDLIPLFHNDSVEEAYQRTEELVLALDKLGIHRYWFSEHHNSKGYASVSPELLVAYMAGQTKQIRLGTGGTMIMHYSPLKVAEDFKTLSALAPNRIDLGIGRAPGAGRPEVMALSNGRPLLSRELYQESQIIADYIQDKPAQGLFGETEAMPKAQALPELWMLGSTGASATKAGEMGLGYSFAKFFAVETDREVFDTYRETFQPSGYFDRPQVMVSYMIIVAEDQADLDYYSKMMEMIQLRTVYGKALTDLTMEAVQDYRYDDNQRKVLETFYKKRFMIKGRPEEVKAILDDEIQRYGIDEIMAYTPLPDNAARITSYRLLKEMFSE